jgi:uncharacterized membrane protein YebE (DUF533 family)
MFDAKSLLNMVLGAGQQAMQGGQASGGMAGGIGGILSNVLGQATQGMQQGAQDLGKATGVNTAGLGDKFSQMTGGRSAEDLLAQAKEMIGNNQGLAAAAAAGIGGLLLGTSGGRGLIGSAAKLGGLALIGGLAYKAVQNYQAGKPLLTAGAAIAAAPQGSGYAEGDSDDQERALLMVRSMIAAAAADGEIDDAERARILGNLKQAGLDDEASTFLDDEFANPLDAAGLVQLSSSPEMAAQIYTAARLAVDPDTNDEQNFLADLSAGLELDAELVAHIDAAAAGIMESQAA